MVLCLAGQEVLHMLSFFPLQYMLSYEIKEVSFKKKKKSVFLKWLNLSFIPHPHLKITPINGGNGPLELFLFVC